MQRTIIAEPKDNIHEDDSYKSIPKIYSVNKNGLTLFMIGCQSSNSIKIPNGITDLVALGDHFYPDQSKEVNRDLSTFYQWPRNI